MKRETKKGSRTGLGKLAVGSLIGLGAAVIALALWLSGALEPFELKTWDARVRLLSKPGPATDQVVLVLLDQNSLDWAAETLGLSWPWPRETYAAVTAFCARAGARSLAFDVLYTEDSGYGVYDDEAFAAAAADFGKVAASVFLSEASGNATAWPEGIPRPELELTAPEARQAARLLGALTFPRAAFPIPELARSARVLANVNLTRSADLDGVYRRAPLLNLFDSEVLPTLGVGAWMAAEPGTPTVGLGPGSAVLGGREVPLDRAGRALLRYRGPLETYRALSAAALIESELKLQMGEPPTVNPQELQGRYVLFGFSAPGLYDLRSSPVSGTYPGVGVHATLLDNLLSGDFMRDLPVWLTVLLTLGLAVGAGLAAVHTWRVARTVLLYVGALALPLGLSLAGYALGRWVPLLALEAGAVLALVGGGVVNYATEGKQRRYLKGAFRQYLSPAVVEQLIAHPERLTLGGEQRELSIYFSDIQGFTTISEALNPQELTAFLNDYLSAMTDIIQEEGGTIDKYEGDAVIAFWNAPLEQPDHAVRAVRAALRCQERLAELRPGFRERVGGEVFVRIGLNSGLAVVGNMGSRSRFDYTMIGDAVNLGARLEGINKQFRTYTMISAAIHERQAGAFPARELARVRVVGRKEPVPVYEPMLPEQYAARLPLLESFAAALTLFYQGRFAEAEELFARTAGDDPPAAAYVETCRALRASPPEGSWDGVLVMTSK
ncbi:MAG: adenylate/guanylate cyclase domain-containing protein [Spirochaetales bacterium]|nr:adenylate/guanylate cyclase domain-containing protein [Spirochaetales bacterium]